MVAKVEDFTAIANELGLVPMKFKKATITEYVGDIRGVTPETAFLYWQQGLAEPLDGVPEGKAADAGLEGADDEEEDVEIPANWRELHGLKKVSLARKLLGDPKAKIKAEEAEAIIAKEEAARAEDGLPQNGPNSVTTSSLVP